MSAETLVIHIGNAERLDPVFEDLKSKELRLDREPAKGRRAGRDVLLAASFEAPGKGRQLYLLVGILRDAELVRDAARKESKVRFGDVERFSIPVVVSDGTGATNTALTGKEIVWSPSQVYWFDEEFGQRVVAEARRLESYGARMVLRAHVRNGRIVVDEPTDLPEGTELALVNLGPRPQRGVLQIP
jgi:hypothetical protein